MEKEAVFDFPFFSFTLTQETNYLSKKRTPASLVTDALKAFIA